MYMYKPLTLDFVSYSLQNEVLTYKPQELSLSSKDLQLIHQSQKVSNCSRSRVCLKVKHSLSLPLNNQHNAGALSGKEEGLQGFWTLVCSSMSILCWSQLKLFECLFINSLLQCNEGTGSHNLHVSLYTS